MPRRFLCGLVAALFTLLFHFSSADTTIRIHSPSTGETVTDVYSLDEGFPEGSLALRIQGLQIISQRDARFAAPEYRYIRRESFERNGCGPASIHNAFSVLFSVVSQETSEALLLEIMTLLADSNNPAVYPINYQRVVNKLVSLDDASYPVLSDLFSQVDQVVGVGNATSGKVLSQVRKAQGSALIVGRFSLNTSMSDLITLVDSLCEEGHGSAMIAIANLSAGDSDSNSPFCMGDNGHYVTWVIQAQEFRDTGTMYILDSFPRAIRGEKLNDLYTSRYYFADNNILTSFRVNYDVTRISPTALMCTLRDEAMSELERLRELAAGGGSRAKANYRSARSRYASYVKTYGYGTLLIRIMDDEAD